MAADAAMVPYSLMLAVLEGSAEVRISTSTTTDRPGRSRPFCATSGLTVTRTGTRWTILVKLPVAFSGGSRLNTAPAAGETLSTVPTMSVSGKASTFDMHLLTGLQGGELRLLEVGVHMHAGQRHQSRKAGAGLHIGSDLHRLVADDAVDGRADFREGEIALRLVHGGPVLVRQTLTLVLLCGQDLHIRLGGGCRGLGALHLGIGPVAGGLGVLEGSLAGIVGLGELLLARIIALGPLGLGLRADHLRLGLRHRRAAGLDLAADARDGALLGRELVLGRLQGEAIIAVVDLGDQLARLDALVVGDGDGGHVAGDLGRQEGDVSLHIGVVGRDHEAAVGPPFVTLIGAERQSRSQHGQDNRLFAEAPFLGRGRYFRKLLLRLRRLDSLSVPSRLGGAARTLLKFFAISHVNLCKAWDAPRFVKAWALHCSLDLRRLSAIYG